ncbi:NAD(P)-binding protein [Wallemia mellicola]|uniref:NAD(P)-binding protein n=2 Tax=Wallemia mellicola TaxID=1708541 RepID=A0A4T0Q4F3_9BASI|nr:NAD(P)-binding protein [Wallemia mellicola CBS 633.66]TIB74737.1 hypothetical protein E3Q24_00471 [Wallemia mellicola]EIM24109.1 NAD(P)-binding protein [Wallemia mellicola CBS 633.66]TIB79559.1 hypothetical protein E3Q23_00175 [Wallemia mellicola]TIB82687.1 NAD(P)-binding protein [Wallemia mellicola]TIC03713.1 NAD(P)-binding protein [Wallemia mellicola]|eukprot:XP_006955935.1 NAD(P)-binding protein [Wallemia mellicola CBS 633.66]
MQILRNTFVVTGGLGGAGKSIATSLIDQGAYVVILDLIEQKAGEEATKQLSENKAVYVRTDITNEESVKNAMKVASAAFEKRLTGLIHCAGVSMSQPWTNRLGETIDRVKRMTDINFMGTYITSAFFADAVNERFEPEKMAKGELFTTKEERGIIINFSSIAGAQPSSRILGYAPGKAAVTAFSRALADFLGTSGIRVNTISPSVINSAMMGARLPYFIADLSKSASFPARPIEPEEISGAVNYLITNGMMNGHDLQIDGGWRVFTDRSVDREDPRILTPSLE